MRFAVAYPVLLSSLTLFSCCAKTEYGSFKLKNTNRKPVSEFRRYFSISTLQCAVACNTIRDCAGFAFGGSTTKICILSNGFEDNEEEAAGFRYYIKSNIKATAELTTQIKTSTVATKHTEAITSTTEEPTTSAKGTTTQISTKALPDIKRLEINPEVKTYSEAEKACQSANMRLVTIKDKAASDDLEKIIKSSQTKKKVNCDETWVGLKSVEYTDDPFQWSDGDYLKWPKYNQWVNWGNGEPDEYRSGTDNGCVKIVTKKSGDYFRWRDSSCSKQHCFICE